MTDPISTAKAIRATTSTALEVIPESVRKDLIGLFGGDWLREQRVRNQDRLKRRTQEILKLRGVEADTPSASIAEPIIEAAQDESRDELAELFAKLLAAALDPARKHRVRREFVHIAKQLEPLDAALLDYTYRNQIYPSNSNDDFREILAVRLGRQRIEIDVSLATMMKLELVTGSSSSPLILTPTGKLFMLAVSD